MSMQTELPQTLLEKPEPVPQARRVAPAKDTEAIIPRVYWGDLLTLKFWLFCFGLLAAMNLVEALYRLVGFLVGPLAAP